jgi:hypothetical protein
MTMILSLAMIAISMLLLFSDRMIEDIDPKSDFSKMSDETDSIMISMNDNEIAYKN